MKIWNGFYVYLSNIEKISDNDLEYTGAGGRDEREQLNKSRRGGYWLVVRGNKISLVYLPNKYFSNSLY